MGFGLIFKTCLYSVLHYQKFLRNNGLHFFLGREETREIVLLDAFYRGNPPTTITVGPKDKSGVKIKIEDQGTCFDAVVRGWFWVVDGKILGDETSVTWLASILLAVAKEEAEK
jgi:hypothetical protein